MPGSLHWTHHMSIEVTQPRAILREISHASDSPRSVYKTVSRLQRIMRMLIVLATLGLVDFSEGPSRQRPPHRIYDMDRGSFLRFMASSSSTMPNSTHSSSMSRLTRFDESSLSPPSCCAALNLEESWIELDRFWGLDVSVGLGTRSGIHCLVNE